MFTQDGKFRLVGLSLNSEYTLKTLKRGVMTDLGVIKTGFTQLDTPPVQFSAPT